jgi:RNA polymerase sigma factor (sigma-70 family)
MGRKTVTRLGNDCGSSSTGPLAADAASATWEAAIVRYARLIHSIPLRFGLSRDDAEDVFQSTILTAMRRERVPPSEDRIVRWLASIASWETRNVLRKRSPEPFEPAIVEALRGGGDVPRPLLDEAEDLQALADALAALKPRERRLLEALFLAEEPLSYQEVAAAIGVAVGSVGELRRRAIDRLRAELLRRGF